MSIPDILQYDNKIEFKGAFLLILIKHNIKLFDTQPQISLTPKLLEKTNALVKNKIIKWKDVNSLINWISALTEIYNIINNENQVFLPDGIICLQFMFF